MSTNQFSYCTDYDEQLLKIEHFRLHTELLPYVGPHYNDFRILLIGESHYLPEYYAEKQELFEDWYSIGTEKIVWEEGEGLEHQAWFNTRNVIRNYLTYSRSKAHSMFRNPAIEFCDVLQKQFDLQINDSDAFGCFSFYNFFQRPEVAKGASIKTSELDVAQAKGIAKMIIDVLKPSLIVVLTKKAYRYFPVDECRAANIQVEQTVHPTCSWWNRHEYGRAKLNTVFTEYLRDMKDVKGKIDAIVTPRIDLLLNFFQSMEKILCEEGFKVNSDYEEKCRTFYNNRKSPCPKITAWNSKGIEFWIEIDWNIFVGYKTKPISTNNTWEYLPYGGDDEKNIDSRTPNFKTYNEAYLALYEDENRTVFIHKCIEFIKERI